jgi:hypothetical protein
VWGSSVVVPRGQRTVARTPRRIDFDAGCSRRNLGVPGVEPRVGLRSLDASPGGRLVSPLRIAMRRSDAHLICHQMRVAV